MTPTTDIGNDVREAVRQILAKYEGQQYAIAPVKVSTLRAIDAMLNPSEPGFEIPTHRDTPAYRALEQARVDRLLFGA